MKYLVSLLILVVFGCSVGEPGPNGPQGPSGSNGSNGTNGTQVALVQFCPGYPPSKFPELGFCISNQIYAIYDQSNGYDYLTLVPEGHYSSNVTGASCSFTVEPNCEIIN